MIDKTTNSTNRTVFAPLQSNSAVYAISKPFTETQKAEYKEHKEKKSENLGFKIVRATLITGFGAFLLIKGMPKNVRKNVDKLFKYLEEKISKLKLENAKQGGFETFYYKTLNKLKSLTNFSKGYFNIAPLKDIAFKKKVSDKFLIVRKIGDKITEVFEKISVSVSRNSYKKTQSYFADMCNVFNKMKTKISDKNIINDIEQKFSVIQKTYDNNFSLNAHGERLSETKKDMSDIAERFWDRTFGHTKEFLTNIESYRTFLPEELAAFAKMKLQNTVSKLKKEITISINDNYSAVKKQLTNINSVLRDKNSRDFMKDTRKILENYRKTKDSSAKDLLVNNLNKLKSHVSDTKIADEISKSIEILKKEEKGKIQELMDIYQKHLSKEDYAKLEKSVNKALKSLDKSIDTETDKLFDKIRDILIGSAPMDVIGILMALGTVGFWLGKADNKDERISAALKFGIPALGAISVSLYCTLALISGGPAMLIGLVSGMFINKLGVMIDNMRKKYKEQPPTLADAKKLLPDFEKG